MLVGAVVVAIGLTKSAKRIAAAISGQWEPLPPVAPEGGFVEEEDFYFPSGNLVLESELDDPSE